MFFNFQDSDGTPLSRYKVFYSEMLSVNVTRMATNTTAAFVYNQFDTYLASCALGVLSLMSSTDTVLSALGDVYHKIFGRIFEVVPPAAIMSAALMIYIVWAFVERRANIRNLAQDQTRIGVAVVTTLFFSWLLRNPFYLMDRALNWIPDLVLQWLNQHGDAKPKANDGKGTGVTGYLMDAVIRPVTQTLMYGHPLTGPCNRDWSIAMNRGNAPGCAPALLEAPQGAAMASVVLGFFFFVLLVYGVVLLAMYIYQVSMAAWAWFSLLYHMGKALWDVKAFVTPRRRIMVAGGHTLAAAVVNAFAIVGPAVAIAIVNSLKIGDPSFAVILDMVAVIVLFFLSRQATGALLRKTGAIHDHGWFLNRLMAPPAMFGAGAAARRRETVADLASLTSRAASRFSAFPAAALIASGAAAVENRLRPATESQKGGAGRMRILSDTDRETIDGATDVVTVGEGRKQITHVVTWPPAARPVPSAAPDAAAEPGAAAAPPPPAPAAADAQPSGGRHREDRAENVDSASPVAFGGLGPHRLPAPEPNQTTSPTVSSGTDTTDTAPSRAASNPIQDLKARTAELFADLTGRSSTAGSDTGGVNVDDLLSPMVRAYASPLPNLQAAPPTSDAAAPLSGREALRRSADDGVKRERARYVLAALGKNTVPVSAVDDPGNRVYMYNDGTRNVVDSTEGQYVMGPRI